METLGKTAGAACGETAGARGLAGRIPVIVGPTAGGKSFLAVELALAIGGEIVTADAFQVYRGMDIGTAKPTIAERRGVPHHLLDLVEPSEPFTVADWTARAERCIAEIASRGRVPIVVGGTHLYAKALLDGLFEGPGADEALRAELRAMSPADRRAELERVDPVAASRINPNDERRTVRALEVFRLTGTPISRQQRQWDRPGERPYVVVGLAWPVPAINARINARVRDMMARGLLDEVRRLAPTLGRQAREGLGYKQLLEHLDGRRSLDEAVERIKIDTRRFAKNQRTWLKRLRATPSGVWLDAAGIKPENWAAQVVARVKAANEGGVWVNPN